MTLTADEVLLHRVVGSDTLMRGRDYARRGAVVNPRWREDGGHLHGQVRGTGRRPYTAVAILATSPAGALTSFRGSCTCPVGTNCKHAVALVLAARPGAGAQPVAEPVAVPWERSLAPLVGPDSYDVPGEPAIALQFELVLPAPRERGRSAAPRIVLRLAIPGSNGGWVRTGVSWSDLEHASYSLRRVAPQHVRLLGEIKAMGASGSPVYFGHASQPIEFATIASRRIWELLGEAQSLGLPLIHAGRRSVPVTVHREAAKFVMDLSRDANTLVLQPQILAGDERPVPGSALFIGDPAHGIAWWQSDVDSEPTPTSELRLARLATPLDEALRGLALQQPLRIPAQDEGRFFADFYPVLQQRAPLVSTDGSVPLPEPARPALALAVRNLDGHRVGLDWQWVYSVGETVRTEPLWPPFGTTLGRDLHREHGVVEAVALAAHAIPKLFETSVAGTRLAPTAQLTGMDTVRFTTEVLPRLAELGDVTVDTLGTASPYREIDSAPVVEFAGSQSADDRDWFDLAVTVSVDGETVPFEQLFLALSAQQSHLILPSGTYFSLDVPELRTLAELIAEARALQDSPSDTLRLSRFQASYWDELDRLGVISGQAADWQRSARALSNAEFAEIPVPAGLHAVLRPYQRAGASWLAFLYANRLGGILADDMGLGKTLQTLGLICHAKHERGTAAPFLVVAPTSVVSNWASECRRFAPGLKVATITETKTRRERELAHVTQGADVVITSYTLFRLEYEGYAALEWAGLVLDEAQAVKNRQSRGYHCVKKLPAPFKLAITGTPMENNLMELWSLLSITAPGLFASPTHFEKYYRTPIESNRNPDLLAKLRRRVKPLVLRRTKGQVANDLPAKQEQVVELELNPKHRRIYETHLNRERQKVLGLLGDLDRNRFEIFRSLTLLRQLSLDASLVDPAYQKVPSTKLDAFMELLGEVVREGHRTLVFSQFTRFLDLARRRLDAAGIAYSYLDGSTRNRAAVLAGFKSGTAPVFLISLKAGGVGLNLTEADYCILLDPWWNPATEAQAVDRAHRIGQTKNVMVYRLVAKQTIEDKVMALKAKKAALVGSVMDGGAFSSGTLSAADIREMLE